MEKFDIVFTNSYTGKLRIKTRLTLKGRGITLHGTNQDKDVNIYYATEKALEKLKTLYTFKALQMASTRTEQYLK